MAIAIKQTIDSTDLLQISNNQQSDIKNNKQNITMLPVELYHSISKYLDSESIMQFRLTNRITRNNVSLDLVCKKLEPEKKLIEEFFSVFYINENRQPIINQDRASYEIITSSKKLNQIKNLLIKVLSNKRIDKYLCKTNAAFNYVYKSFLNKEGKLPLVKTWNNISSAEHKVTFIQSFTYDLISAFHTNSKVMKKIINLRFITQ